MIDNTISSCGIGYHEPIQVHRNIQMKQQNLVLLQYGPALTNGFSFVEKDLWLMSNDFSRTGELPQDFTQQVDQTDFWINPHTDGGHEMLFEAILRNFSFGGNRTIWHEKQNYLTWDSPLSVNPVAMREFFEKYPKVNQGTTPLFIGQFAHHECRWLEDTGEQLYFHGFNRMNPFRISLTTEFIKITDWFDHQLRYALLSHEEMLNIINSPKILPITWRLNSFIDSSPAAYRVIRSALIDFQNYLDLMKQLRKEVSPGE